MDDVRIPLRFETADGRPRHDAWIVVISAARSMPERALVPDPEGRLDLWLPEGPAEIEVRFATGETRRVTINAGEEREPREFIIR
jgi:hypothetical protein